MPVRRHVPDEDVYVAAGSIQCSVSILPKAVGEKYPQAEGRAEPNSDPFLPEPEGRIKLSFNPLEMIQQLLPPAFLRKIICALIVALCIFLCIMMAPMILSNLIARMLTG